VNSNAILSSTGATAIQWAADGGASTLSGRVTADGGIDIDNFTIDGSSIELSAGSLTVDVAGDIILDADGDNIFFKAAGGTPLDFKQENSGDWKITNDTAQKSIIFRTRPSTGYMEVMRFDCGSDNSDVTFNEGGARLFDFRIETGGLTAGKDHMFFVDGYNDRIGIGITSGLWNSGRPASRVHIEHTETATAATTNVLTDFTLFLKNLSDTTNSFAGIAFDTCSEADTDSIGAAIRAERDSTADETSKHNTNLTFATNDAGDDGLTERMRITRDGLVGIGSASPSHTLDVTGDIRVTDDLFVDDFARIDALRVGTTSTDPGDGNLYVENWIHVAGDVRAAGGNIFGPVDGTLSIRSDTTMQFHIDDDGGESSKEFQWYDDTTERMVLDQSGNLQIDGNLTVTGNRITFGNGEYINNESNGYFMMGPAHVLPTAGDTYDLGSSVYDWRDVYIGRGIQTPDGPLQITPGAGNGHNTMGSIRLMEESANGTNYLEIGCKYHVGGSNYTVEFPSASGDILVSGYTGAQSVGGSFRVNGGTIYGPADDMLELRTDGHMYFVIDDDNDESGKEFRWWDDSVERMTLGQTGDLQIDGDLTVSGNRITFGNSGFIHEEVNGLIHLSENTQIDGTVTINDYIYHAGDTDTFTHFGTNVWSVTAAASSRIQANSTGVGMMGATPIAGLAVGGDIQASDKLISSRKGFCGTYDVAQVQGVWSVGDAYEIDTGNDDFGSHYGLGYFYSDNTSARPANTFFDSNSLNDHCFALVNAGTVNGVISFEGNSYWAGKMQIGATSASGATRLWTSDDNFGTAASGYQVLMENTYGTANHRRILNFRYSASNLNSNDYAIRGHSNGTGTLEWYIRANGDGNLTLTGQHWVVFVADTNSVNAAGNMSSELEPGMIVESTGEIWLRRNTQDTIPKVRKSSAANSKTVFGVMSSDFDCGLDLGYWNDYNGTMNSASSLPEDSEVTDQMNYSNSSTEFKCRANSVGEGGIWVTNLTGNIENGDYITSSPISGYGQLQDDDLLHNYTVAKCTEAVDWNSLTDTIDHEGQAYKKYLVGCTYHCG